MNKLSASVLALGCLLAPATSAAQTVIYAPWGAPPPAVYVVQQAPDREVAPPADLTRIRFGIGGNLTFASAKDLDRRVNAGSFGAGLTVDLGVQVSRSLAVYAHGVASTMILTGQASLHGVVEYTPTDVLSLGTGLGWQGVAMIGMQADATCCDDYVPTRRSWNGVSIPAIVGFNFGSRLGDGGRRRAFRLNFEGAVGVEPSTGAVGWQTSIGVGYVAM